MVLRGGLQSEMDQRPYAERGLLAYRPAIDRVIRGPAIHR